MSVKRPQLIHWIGITCVFCCQISIGRNKRKQTTEIFEKQVSQWCPLCSRWRHRRLSLWQPPVPTMTIKSASCQPLVLRAVFSPLDAALSELSITQQQRSYITLIHVKAPAQPQEADKALYTQHIPRNMFCEFTRYWPFERGIHRSPVNSPHKGQWRGALMSSLICA